MSWLCRWVEETGESALYLRRYAHLDDDCPAHDYRYHEARIYATTLPTIHKPYDPDYFARSQYPTQCECGYVFTEDDYWQVWTDRIYRDPSNGQEWGMINLPVGALFDGYWMPEKGPDGIALMVVLPPEDKTDARSTLWHVDGPSSTMRERGQHGVAWTRTGDPRAEPPTVDVNPSIRTDRYHGFLRHGVLTDPL